MTEKPIQPDAERRELIDNGHLPPDPQRDALPMEDWNERCCTSRLNAEFPLSPDRLIPRPL
jgi:hypothetical protein